MYLSKYQRNCEHNRTEWKPEKPLVQEEIKSLLPCYRQRIEQIVVESIDKELEKEERAWARYTDKPRRLSVSLRQRPTRVFLERGGNFVFFWRLMTGSYFPGDDVRIGLQFIINAERKEKVEIATPLERKKPTTVQMYLYTHLNATVLYEVEPKRHW